MTTNIDDIAKNIEIREKEQKRSVILGVLRSTAGIRQAMSDAFKRRDTDEVIRLASQLTMNADVDPALELYMNCEKNKANDVPEETDFDPDDDFQLTDKGRAFVKQMMKERECHPHEEHHGAMRPCVKRSPVDPDSMKMYGRSLRQSFERNSTDPSNGNKDSTEFGALSYESLYDSIRTKKKRGRPAKKRCDDGGKND